MSNGSMTGRQKNKSKKHSKLIYHPILPPPVHPHLAPCQVRFFSPPFRITKKPPPAS